MKKIVICAFVVSLGASLQACWKSTTEVEKYKEKPMPTMTTQVVPQDDGSPGTQFTITSRNSQNAVVLQTDYYLFDSAAKKNVLRVVQVPTLNMKGVKRGDILQECFSQQGALFADFINFMNEKDPNLLSEYLASKRSGLPTKNEDLGDKKSGGKK